MSSRGLAYVCVLAALAVGATAPGASAAEVSHFAGGDIVDVAAEAGETNVISVTRQPGAVLVREDGDTEIEGALGDCTKAHNVCSRPTTA